MASPAQLALTLLLLATSVGAASTARPTVTLSAGLGQAPRQVQSTSSSACPLPRRPSALTSLSRRLLGRGPSMPHNPSPLAFNSSTIQVNARNRSIAWFSTPGPPAGESEDCLYLNIFAPSGATSGSKAVMFWLFGGGYVFGTGSLPLYNGTSFAENQDVVVVTINYRTGLFGFPGSPEKPPLEQNLG